MIECRSPFWWICVAALLALALATPRVASALHWTLKVVPPGSGTITWMTSSPPGSGTTDTGVSILLDENEWLDLTFEPKPGYKLFSVYKDSDNWTPFLDPGNHFAFGPVSSNHKIKATFPLIPPTGVFIFRFPADDPAAPAIVDVTGSYSGEVYGPFQERSYAVDVAMDEDGKLDMMGTVDGIEPKPGGDPLSAAGRVKTVDDQPLAQVKTKFEGTVDGVPASCKASAESPMEVKDLGGANGIEGTHTYKATYGGVKFKDKDRPLQVGLDEASVDNIAKVWSLRLDISEQVNLKSGKPSVVADTEMTLQNGDVIVFPQKTVKYSEKKGYNISISKGTNVTAAPPRPAKKTKGKIKDMTFTPNGPDFELAGGTVEAKLLGQREKDSLSNVLQP